MSFWTDLRLPCEQDLLIGFYDLKGYVRQAEASAPLELLELISGYFALTGKLIDESGGRLIKTLGDAGLVAYPAAWRTPAYGLCSECGARDATGSRRAAGARARW